MAILHRRSLFSSLLMLAAAPLIAVAAVARQVFDYLFSFVPVEPMSFATTGVSMDTGLTGLGLDRSLLNSMRHEAGVSRRAAARNT